MVGQIGRERLARLEAQRDAAAHRGRAGPVAIADISNLVDLIMIDQASNADREFVRKRQAHAALKVVSIVVCPRGLCITGDFVEHWSARRDRDGASRRWKTTLETLGPAEDFDLSNIV